MMMAGVLGMLALLFYGMQWFDVPLGITIAVVAGTFVSGFAIWVKREVRVPSRPTPCPSVCRVLVACAVCPSLAPACSWCGGPSPALCRTPRSALRLQPSSRRRRRRTRRVQARVEPRAPRATPPLLRQSKQMPSQSKQRPRKTSERVVREHAGMAAAALGSTLGSTMGNTVGRTLGSTLVRVRVRVRVTQG